MKVRVTHVVEYEVEVEVDSTTTLEQLHADAVNELVHSGTVSRVRRQTGVESWKISGFGG